MSNFTVEPTELNAAGGRIAPIASALGSENIPQPDPQMYGTLVGASATDAEPFTTTQLNALLSAEGALVDSISQRLVQNARQYESCEAENIALAGSFLRSP